MSRFQTFSNPLTLMAEGGESPAFLPWGPGEQGARTWFKLERQGEIVLLDGGGYPALPVAVHKNLMRLINEGWSVQGEVHVTFDGLQTGEEDPFIDTDVVTLQVGRRLLPLVDPQNGSLLLEKLRQTREELAADLGFVLPGVRVTDNLTLRDHAYAVLLRQTLVAEGEVFLERLLAVGTLDQLSNVQGWSTQEPAFRMTAKWIDPQDRERAEAAGCLVVGGLNVLMTHVQELLRQHAAELLGLQDLHNLLARLGLSHPIVVDEFLRERRALRLLRKVLHRLLEERVSIRNLITIVEAVGDAREETTDVDEVTEAVRGALARQILASVTADDGSVHALLLADPLEKRLADHVAGGDAPAAVEDVIRRIRQVWEEHGSPAALFTLPRLRRPLRNLLQRSMPQLSVLSTADVPPATRVHVVATVAFPAAVEKPVEKPREGTMWKKKAR